MLDQSLFKKYQRPPAKPAVQTRSERDEQIQRFASRGDIKIADPKSKTLRPASPAELALILRNVPTTELHSLYRKCEGAETFSKLFWWFIKNPPRSTRI